MRTAGWFARLGIEVLLVDRAKRGLDRGRPVYAAVGWACALREGLRGAPEGWTSGKRDLLFERAVRAFRAWDDDRRAAALTALCLGGPEALQAVLDAHEGSGQ